MKIVIFSPTSTLLEFSDSQPLGGADSTLITMIKTLTIAGNEISAYIPVKKEFGFNNAKIYPFNSIFDFPLECDLLILYRKVWAVPNNVKYKKCVFYSQDTADTPCFAGLKGNRNALNMYDKVWVLSEYHKNNIKALFDVPEDKFTIIGNFAEVQEDVEKVPLQFIYASTPFRGLEVLLKAWQSIVAKYPSATLHVFSSMKIYGAEQLDDLHFGRMFNDMKSGRFKNLIFHGSKPQKEMLECMKKSFMLLYPNTYPETYCNVLMEARACKTPFITSNLGALKETGSHAGCYIEGHARTPEYLQKFLDTLDFIIADPNFYATLQNNCNPIRTYEDYRNDLLNEVTRLNKD